MRGIGAAAMALATRVRRGGVIVNEHTLGAGDARVHVEALGRWFDFIALDELPERLERRSGKPFCLVTFDDGKASNATQAAPELERLGVPAVFYVVTGFLSDGRPLWFDRYAALRRQLDTPPQGLEPEVVKQLPLGVLEERLDSACEQHDVTVDRDSENVRPMSWDQARDLARRGFGIGAHTVRHAILPHEPEPDAQADIERSMEQVSAELGEPCRTFAFPNGNYTDALARFAQSAGASTVMTTEPTWVDAGCPLWRLPRVQLFPGSTPDRIDLKLAVAATGRILQNPDGTGRRYRRMRRAAA